ncbi:hypothetical protein [Nocardia nova]|uniref:hypothetical protein n=1 Tax=Nocardia nova TaxID=37330 RepID=UPI0033F34945
MTTVLENDFHNAAKSALAFAGPLHHGRIPASVRVARSGDHVVFVGFDAYSVAYVRIPIVENAAPLDVYLDAKDLKSRLGVLKSPIRDHRMLRVSPLGDGRALGAIRDDGEEYVFSAPQFPGDVAGDRGMAMISAVYRMPPVMPPIDYRTGFAERAPAPNIPVSRVALTASLFARIKAATWNDAADPLLLEPGPRPTWPVMFRVGDYMVGKIMPRTLIDHEVNARHVRESWADTLSDLNAQQHEHPANPYPREWDLDFWNSDR